MTIDNGNRIRPPIRIISVIGTRPEAIKMAPIIRELNARDGFEHHLVASGQQDDLFDRAIAGFGIVVDDHLGQNPGGGDAEQQVRAIKDAVRIALSGRSVDIILVQGDTNTALAAAQAGDACDIPVGHVEAGLRSFDPNRPFPEERNRIEIAQVSTLHFAPSRGAAANLNNEGVTKGVFITGNPGIDTLLQLNPTGRQLETKMILASCHRRENFGLPLDRICTALFNIASRYDVMITLPIHPNPKAASAIIGRLGKHPKINLVQPMPYAALIDQMKRSHFVISDSGGMQEESAALGIPMLILREETERPEVIESGNAVLVGSDSALIEQEATRLIIDPRHHATMSRPCFPYGEGDAAGKIVDAIASHFSGLHPLY